MLTGKNTLIVNEDFVKAALRSALLETVKGISSVEIDTFRAYEVDVDSGKETFAIDFHIPERKLPGEVRADELEG